VLDLTQPGLCVLYTYSRLAPQPLLVSTKLSQLQSTNARGGGTVGDAGRVSRHKNRRRRRFVEKLNYRTEGRLRRADPLLLRGIATVPISGHSHGARDTCLPLGPARSAQ
jgi:hypothetical protein